MIWVAFVELKAAAGRNPDGTIGAFTYLVVREHSRKRAAVRTRLDFRGDVFFVSRFDELVRLEEFDDPSDLILEMVSKAEKTGRVVNGDLHGFEFDCLYDDE